MDNKEMKWYVVPCSNEKAVIMAKDGSLVSDGNGSNYSYPFAEQIVKDHNYALEGADISIRVLKNRYTPPVSLLPPMPKDLPSLPKDHVYLGKGRTFNKKNGSFDGYYYAYSFWCEGSCSGLVRDFHYAAHKDSDVVEMNIHVAEQETLYYIHDTTRGYIGNSMVWWRLNHQGYTTNPNLAHAFKRDELHGMADDLVAYPVKEVRDAMESHVTNAFPFSDHGIKLGANFDG